MTAKKEYTEMQERTARFAKATVSQHLKELKDVGLIQGEIEMPKVKYVLTARTGNWQTGCLMTYSDTVSAVVRRMFNQIHKNEYSAL